MASRPIRVRFVEASEIRMGSPFKHCRVVLSGRWVPELPDCGDGFQDLSAWSPAGEHLGLVRWDIDRNNEPGFRVLIVGLALRTVTQSRRVTGCCETLAWSDGGFSYRAFKVVQGRVAVTAGCALPCAAADPASGGGFR